MRARDKRLARVQHAIDASPVRRGILREAYEWFTYFGELPEDDDHVAFEVVQQALRGGEERELEDESAVAWRAKKAALAYHERERPAEQWPPSVRGFLFDEALFHPLMRDVARAAIALEVAYGGDVESPGFAARHGLPIYGSIASHVLGYPRKYVQPPYEFQATRLLTRFDALRQLVPQDDDAWFVAQAKGIIAFKETGELPDDDLQAKLVLANVELDQLVAHKKGQDVSEVMAAFDKVARHEDDEQAEALKELCELAKAGRLR